MNRLSGSGGDVLSSNSLPKGGKRLSRMALDKYERVNVPFNARSYPINHEDELNQFAYWEPLGSKRDWSVGAFIYRTGVMDHMFVPQELRLALGTTDRTKNPDYASALVDNELMMEQSIVFSRRPEWIEGRARQVMTVRLSYPRGVEVFERGALDVLNMIAAQDPTDIYATRLVITEPGREDAWHSGSLAEFRQDRWLASLGATATENYSA